MLKIRKISIICFGSDAQQCHRTSDYHETVLYKLTVIFMVERQDFDAWRPSITRMIHGLWFTRSTMVSYSPMRNINMKPMRPIEITIC